MIPGSGRTKWFSLAADLFYLTVNVLFFPLMISLTIINLRETTVNIPRAKSPALLTETNKTSTQSVYIMVFL